MTNVGTILGTAAYMSPEQAKGRDADKRSDVWAFGCVLYEMLTGRRAFASDSVQETLALVLTSEPDWHRPATRRARGRAPLLEGCLAKDPRKRVADISVAEFLLAERNATLLSGQAPIGRPVTRRERLVWAAGLVAAVSVAGVLAAIHLVEPVVDVSKHSVFSGASDRCLGVGGWRQRRSRVAGRTSRRPSCLSSGWRAGQTGHSSV